MPKIFLSCPFCGSNAQIEPWHGGGPEKHLVSCASEECEVSPSVTGETLVEAQQKWNRRTIVAIDCGGEAPPVYVTAGAAITFDDIRAADDKIDAARTNLAQVIAQAFPPGKEIQYQYGNYVQRGVITRVGGHGGISVRNLKTAKKVSIHWSQIKEVSL